MGAETRYLTFDNCASEAELQKRWREAVEEDTYDRGHGSYNGSIRHVDSPYVHRVSYATREEAQKAASAMHVDKGSAVAFRYGDAAKCAFPQTERDKQQSKKLDELEKELFLFNNSILKRFVTSKSASKRCGHCDSVISKKSRERLAREDYAKQHAALARVGHFDARDYEAEQVNCPACNHNLLLTDTDIKRRQSLEARVKELRGKVEEARKDHLSKVKPFGYIVQAVAPS